RTVLQPRKHEEHEEHEEENLKGFLRATSCLSWLRGFVVAVLSARFIRRKTTRAVSRGTRECLRARRRSGSGAADCRSRDPACPSATARNCRRSPDAPAARRSATLPR